MTWEIRNTSGVIINWDKLHVTTHETGGVDAIDHGSIDGLSDDDHTQYIKHALATAANDFLVASGSGAFVKKTLAETGAILEADIDHGNIQGLTDDDHTQYIKDAEFTQDSGILVGTGSGTFAEETGATLRTSIGLGNVENTAHSTDAHTMTIDGVDVSAHDIATTGVHGAGANTILYSDHTANADAHHAETHTHALAAGATDVTATAAEVNLLDLAGLTAGELLVATAATTAAWQSTGVLLDTPTIQGTVSAGTGLTLPAITLSGQVSGANQTFDAGASLILVATTQGGRGVTIQRTGDGADGAGIVIEHISGDPDDGDRCGRFVFRGTTDVAQREFADLRVNIDDVTDGTRTASLQYYLFSSGSQNLAWSLSGSGSVTLDENLLVDEYIQVTEMAAPGAGAANTARIYALEGAGDALTDLIAVFQDGSTDKFAEETTPDNSPLFTMPSKTPMQIELRKDHPGLIRVVAIFPNGEEFDLKHHEFHDAEKIRANVNCEGSLPDGWEVTTLQERVDRNVAILDEQIDGLIISLEKLDSEFANNESRLGILSKVAEPTDENLTEIKNLGEKQSAIPDYREAICSRYDELLTKKQLELARL